MKLLAFANLSTLVLTTATISTTQPLELSEGILSVQIDQAIHSECADKAESGGIPEPDLEV